MLFFCIPSIIILFFFFFFFNDTATTEIYTLSLHDALPISSVSRLHAGITSVEGEYYIRNLRRGNPIMLNGAPFEEYEALADGDVIGIGPFALNIHFVQGILAINVSLQIAATAGDSV